MGLPVTPETFDRYEHGSASTYTNHRCRCDACREAQKLKAREYKARRASGALGVPTRHGVYTTYHNWSCRCAPCTAAWTEYQRRLRARRAGAA